MDTTQKSNDWRALLHLGPDINGIQAFDRVANKMIAGGLNQRGLVLAAEAMGGVDCEYSNGSLTVADEAGEDGDVEISAVNIKRLSKALRVSCQLWNVKFERFRQESLRLFGPLIVAGELEYIEHPKGAILLVRSADDQAITETEYDRLLSAEYYLWFKGAEC